MTSRERRPDDRVTEMDPEPSSAGVNHLRSLGIALEQQGQHEAAFNAFDQAVVLRPDDAGLWASRGNVLASLARPEESLASYQRALQLSPKNADAAFRCGLLLLTLRRQEQALPYFDLADELYPNHPAIKEQRALALHALGRFDEALVENQLAHALNPTSADVCNNIGACLQGLNQDAEALPWFDKAIALRPDSVVALINKARSLTQMLRLEEAMGIYGHVQAIDPDNADAIWNLALLCLLTGDFASGWAGREIRWQAHMRPPYPDFDQPRWCGTQDVEGKTVLLYAEEGNGDTIQFVRYAPVLAARGARVILAVQDALQPLLTGLSGVSLCIARSAPLPPFDLHCPICSLPFAFGTRLETIPSTTPYLPPPAQARLQSWERRLRERLGPDRACRVGLVWSGNPNHGNDRNRSVPLRTLLGLLDVDAAFVSLQKDARPEDQAILEQGGVVDLTADLSDFAETAALVSCLDIVITVDTGVAHLAGALGRPTWIMLPYSPDFRWLLDCDDSPWYPTARLFRQTAARDWNEVVDRVRSALATHVRSFKAEQD